MKDRKGIIKVLLSFLVIALLVKICWAIADDAILGEKIENKMDVIPSYITYEVGNDESLKQTFIPTYGYMKQFNVLMLHVGDEYNGKLNVEIGNELGQLFWNNEYDISNLKAGEWFPIEVESYVLTNKPCTITFTVDGAKEPVLFMLANRAFNTEENQILHDTNNQEVAGGMLITYDYRLTLQETTKVIYCILACILAALLILCINTKNPGTYLKNAFFKDDDLKTTVYILCLLMLAGVFYFTHIYRLWDTPYGLHIDEAGMGFDAWSLANFGVDRYMIKYPVYLINFGGGQSAMHAYFVAILIKIFGYSEKLFRIPALFNAILMLIAGSLLVRKRWGKRAIVLLFSTLFMIFPVFVMFTRFGYDCNLMMGLSTCMLLLVVEAIDKEDIKLYVVAGIITGLTLYTYVISYLILPLFLVILLVYLIWIKRINWRMVIAFTVPVAILGMPLVLEQLVNIFQLSEMHLGPITIPRMPIYRANELGLEHYWSNLYDTLKCTFWNDMWNYDSFPEYKMMYWFTIPFGIVGICQATIISFEAICDRKFHIDTIILSYFCCVFFTGGLLDGGSGLTCYKINSIYLPLLYYVVHGMIVLYSKLKSEKWMLSMLLILGVSYMISFGQFTDYYYGKEYHDGMIPSFFFNYTYHEIITEIENRGLEDVSRDIYVETGHSTPIYFYLSKMISPFEQKFAEDVTSYRNYYFKFREEMEIDTSKIYILSVNSRNFAIELEKNGMLVNKIGEYYFCY